jgi:carboxymethylenebutenolidase
MAETIELQIGGVRTTALVALPPGGARAGVVHTFHREGLDEFTVDQVDAFAAAGFAVIAPNHYHVMPPGKTFEDRRDYLTDEQQAADCAAAAEWLIANAGVDRARLAVLGPCMGGRTTVVALEANPELWACGCDWYGGGVFRAAVGAWPAPGDVERLKRVRAPLAGFFGSLDTHPSPDDVNKLDALMTELGKPHVFHRYDNVNHAFLNSHGKKYHATATEDSMTRAIAFLREHLRVG